jgi:hypothetical protein
MGEEWWCNGAGGAGGGGGGGILSINTDTICDEFVLDTYLTAFVNIHPYLDNLSHLQKDVLPALLRAGGGG